MCQVNCNLLGFYSAQSHISLFPTTPRNHGRPQTEATPRGALLVHYAPCPIRISISLQSHVNTKSISHAISNCALQVSQHMLRCYPMHMSQLTHELDKCTHYIENIWSGVNQIHQ